MNVNGILFNTQNICAETGKAVLIKMPAKCKYAGMSFWYPSRMIRDRGGNGYYAEIMPIGDKSVRLIKYGQGRYNSRKIIDSREITFEQLRDSFVSTSENIRESKLHEAKRIPVLDIPVEVGIDEDLRDED